MHYAVFEPGEFVTAVSPRSPLDIGVRYKVVEYIHPNIECGERAGTIFVEGQRTGLSTEYVVPWIRKEVIT
jgi:hypothetical protein